MTDEGLFAKSVRGARWVGLSKVLTTAVTWILTILVMRILGPDIYGVVAMGGMLTTLVSMLLDAGLGAAFIQRQNVSKAEYRSANLLLLLGSFAAVGIVQLLAKPMADFFSAPELDPVLRVSSLQFVVAAMAVAPQAALTKEMRFRELALIQFLAGVGSSLLTLGLALGGTGVWALVFGTLSLNVLKLVLILLVTKEFVGFSANFKILVSYWSFSAHLIAQRMTWFWVEQLDQLIVGKYLGAASLGSYSTARNLSHTPLDRSAEIINQISLPAFAMVQHDASRWHAAFGKLLRLSAAAAFPAFWGMAAVAPVFLPILLGPKWDSATVPFMLFCAILPLRMSHSLTGTVLLALGRANLSFVCVLIWAIILSPLFFIGARYGLVGVTAAWAFGFPLVYAITIWMISHFLRVPASIMLRPMLMPAVAAGLCAGVVVALQALLHGVLQSAISLPLQIAAGGVTYLLSLRLLSPATFEEARDLLMRALGRARPPRSGEIATGN